MVLELLSWAGGSEGNHGSALGQAGGEVSALSEAGLSTCKCRILCYFTLLFSCIE